MNEVTKKELTALPYGELKNKFADLGLAKLWADMTGKGLRKKSVLIEAALLQLAEVKQAICGPEAYTVTARPIKTEIENAKGQNTPNTKPNEKTQLPQNQSFRNHVLTNPVLTNQAAENPVSTNPVFTNQTAENQPVKDSKAKLGKKNEISKNPKSKIDSTKPVYKNVMAKHKYSKEILEKNIKIVNANLQNNIPGQRPTLLEKKKELIKMLDLYK